jgi:hypothetical protein
VPFSTIFQLYRGRAGLWWEWPYKRGAIVNLFLSLYINRYEWKKSGVKLQNSLQIKVDETTGKMSIISAEIADYGSYQCFAINEVGIAVSAEFQINRGCKYYREKRFV